MANMKLIEAKTVNPAVSSVVFSAIPQTYTDLKLVHSVKSNDGAVDSVRIRPNGSTSNMYTRWIQGDITGTSGSVISESYPFALTRCNGNNVTSTWGSGEFYIANYASTTLNKSLWTFSTSESGGERMLQNMSAALWSDTTAISSITLVTESGQNFLTNSTFYLYGIESSAITGTKATGGVIYQDTTYFYHVFGTTGIFTPTQSLSADVLVVAGGGGAGGTGSGNDGGSGGGGAGGYRLLTSQSFSNGTAYTCTVGAGGNGGASNAIGSTGTNSSITGTGFTTITSSGGGGGSAQFSGNGASGGSGGGGGWTRSNGTGNAGGYTPVEGYAGGIGGTGSPGSTNVGGGGGGGAGGAGEGTTATHISGSGGIGSSSASSWGLATGTGQNVDGIVYYAGGGAGGIWSLGNISGAGGSGGGAVGVKSGNGNNATANTGGGGGGTGANSSNSGGSGGSGLVIVRYAK